MSSGAPAKMLANKQMFVAHPDCKTYGRMTFHAIMAIVNYARFDILIPEKIPPPEIHLQGKLVPNNQWNESSTVGWRGKWIQQW